MNRRTLLTLASAPAILSHIRPTAAQAKQTVTYAYLLDPAYDAAVWALANGRVTSDLITVDARPLNIPALIQATATKQFDVVMTAVIAIPPAVARGLDLRILSAALYWSAKGEGGGVWVRKDGAVRDPRELKGAKLGSYGLRSTGYMFVRQALAKRFGLNMALDGGDVEQVEVAAANLPAALATRKVDAATLIHSQAYRAAQSGEFVNICETSQIMGELYGRMVSAVNVGFPDRLAARPEIYGEFCRKLKQSVDYALANRAEVFTAVGKQANIDPAFLDWWYDRTTEVPGTFTDAHAKAVTTAWQIGREMGMVNAVPDVKALTWPGALQA